MPCRSSTSLFAAALIVAAAPAAASPDEGPLPVRLGGYVQPQVRARQDSAADNDQDGFRFRRARLTMRAERVTHGITLGVELEAELTPEFSLLDGFVTARGALPADGAWRVDLGQVKAPFSRQTLLSDAALALPEKAELHGLAPDRQIGARAGIAIPGLPLVELWGGVFNGEGRNQVANIDERFMLVGRVEVRPLGRAVRLQESGFEDYLAIGANVFTNDQQSPDGRVLQRGFGGDVAGAWRGIHGSVELVRVRYRYPQVPALDHAGMGWAASAGYLLPLPGYLARRIDVVGRVEEIDRNDTFPVTNPGEPNQSMRIVSLGVGFYAARHDVKVQLVASHYQEIETRDRAGNSIVHDNDLLLLQATFRME